MLAFVAYPMVVGFGLPERLPGDTKDAVGFAGSGSLHRFQQPAWMDLGEQEDVDVIRHDDECPYFEVVQGDTLLQGINHGVGYGGLAQIYGPACGLVQVAVNPNERFTGRGFVGGWETAVREAAMEVPGEEEPLALGVVMRQPAASDGHMLSVQPAAEKSHAEIRLNDARLGVETSLDNWRLAFN